jgi:hypothetical protein
LVLCLPEVLHDYNTKNILWINKYFFFVIAVKQVAKLEDGPAIRKIWCPACQQQLENHRLEILEHLALHCHKMLSQSALLKKRHGLTKEQVSVE